MKIYISSKQGLIPVKWGKKKIIASKEGYKILKKYGWK